MPLPLFVIHALTAVVTDSSVSPPPSGHDLHNPSSGSFASADNLADASAAVLKCFHHTATYRKATIIQRPWPRQTEFGARASAVVRIEYQGIAGNPYYLDAAIMMRPGAVRTYLVSNGNNRIPAKGMCELSAQWIPLEPPQAPSGR